MTIIMTRIAFINPSVSEFVKTPPVQGVAADDRPPNLPQKGHQIDMPQATDFATLSRNVLVASPEIAMAAPAATQTAWGTSMPSLIVEGLALIATAAMAAPVLAGAGEFDFSAVIGPTGVKGAVLGLAGGTVAGIGGAARHLTRKAGFLRSSMTLMGGGIVGATAGGIVGTLGGYLGATVGGAAGLLGGSALGEKIADALIDLFGGGAGHIVGGKSGDMLGRAMHDTKPMEEAQADQTAGQAVSIADCDESPSPEDAVASGNRASARGPIREFLRSLGMETRMFLTSKDAFVHYTRGIAKDRSGDYHGAIADYDEVIRLYPKFSNAYNNRGAAKINLGDYHGTIADCNEAIRLDPKCVLTYNNRGAAKKELGDYHGAIADCNEAIRLDPKCVLAYNNRGAAKKELGDYHGAIADCNEAIRLDPKYVFAYHNRGVVYDDLGEHAKAKADFRKILSLEKYGSQLYKVAQDWLKKIEKK